MNTELPPELSPELPPNPPSDSSELSPLGAEISSAEISSAEISATEGSQPRNRAAAEKTLAEMAGADPARDRHECLACGYIYEPAKGDDRRNVAPNTPFSDLAINWRCPVCGAPKSQFKNVGPKGAPSGFQENLSYGFGVNTLTPGQKNVLIFGALGVMVLMFLSLYGLR